ncbi:MAG: DUF1080 domain-containing protein [Phycisphaeraceae bacterium]|nr:DUF1080 domain-containing protein [Phycisphaeraceae bacterium]MCW5754106.1 DUF1080 domain-containing protein [Phycisphaeraceae bacterium]
MTFSALLLTVCTAAFCAPTPNHERAESLAPPNTLTAIEAASGWQLLFDGATSTGWRGFRQPAFPTRGWVIVDGELRHTKGGGGGDIVTTDQFGDFELSLEFRVTPGANSGIIYRASEKHGAPWMTGPEYQVLDDAASNMTPDHMHSVGSVYEMCSPAADKPTKPAGEWNHARIRIYDGVLQHFLNGREVVNARLDGREWQDKIRWSKFRGYAGFGMESVGHIALQDHGDEVHYRNIKVRDLKAPMPGEVVLFNGRDLTGWDAFVPELSNRQQSPASVWSVQDGVLVCRGTPAGYISTQKTYKNFVLKLEWRWNPITKKTGNSGVLVRQIGEDKVWPKSVEAQLMHGSAGDFWNIGEFTMKTDPARTSGRNTRKTLDAERPAGEWNTYEIIVYKGEVILRVNGIEVNRAWDVEEVAGKICLQSEGTEIQFRNIRLVELD